MVWLLRAAFLLIAAIPVKPVAHQPPVEETPRTESKQFFSGVVTDLPGSRITVDRVQAGQPTESRSFQITAETKVEGRLRKSAKVTVQYLTGDQGDVALHIIVRTNAGAPKKG